jgi:hypothetical protein
MDPGLGTPAVAGFVEGEAAGLSSTSRVLASGAAGSPVGAPPLHPDAATSTPSTAAVPAARPAAARVTGPG